VPSRWDGDFVSFGGRFQQHWSGQGCEERVCWQVCALSGHTSGVLSAVFSPDSKQVVSGAADCLLKIWDAETGAEVRNFFNCRDSGGIICLFQGGALSAWCWGESDVMMFWQVCTLTGHTGQVRSVMFSPDGKRIVSGSEDNLVKIWDAATGAEVSSYGGCTQ